MKSNRNLKKLMAIGAVALLLLPCFFGCTGVVGSIGPPAQAEPAVAANAQAAEFLAGTGNIGVKRLSSISPAARPVAEAPAKAQVINVLDMQGTVTVVSGGAEMPAYTGMRLSAGDKLTTGNKSRATLDLNNGGTVLVEKNSALEITQSTTEYIEVSLLSGNIVNSIEKGAGKYAVKANNVTMGVLGTVFRVSLSTGTAKIDLYEGRVNLTLTAADGTEYSFDLGEWMSFAGTDDAINNSIESGELDASALDLTVLPDDALNWITQQLMERAPDDGEDAAVLNELISNLQDEIERRAQDDIPAAPPPAPADTSGSTPATPPAPVFMPKLAWKSLTVYTSGTVGNDPILQMAWDVTNGVAEDGTRPYQYGYRWNVEQWNPIDQQVETRTIGGVTYYLYSPTSEMINLSSSDHLDDFWEDGTNPELSVCLANEAGNEVYDRNTVTLRNKTPEITVSNTPTTEDPPKANVTVDPILDDVETYQTIPGESEDPRDRIVIDTTGPVTQIPLEQYAELSDLPLYPDGVECVAVAEEKGNGVIDVNVYLGVHAEPAPGFDPDPPTDPEPDPEP